jgi:hypothetical protein
MKFQLGRKPIDPPLEPIPTEAPVASASESETEVELGPVLALSERYGFRRKVEEWYDGDGHRKVTVTVTVLFEAQQDKSTGQYTDWRPVGKISVSDGYQSLVNTQSAHLPIVLSLLESARVELKHRGEKA